MASADLDTTTGLDATAIVKVQAQVRQYILRAFVRRGLIDKHVGDEQKNYWPGVQS